MNNSTHFGKYAQHYELLDKIKTALDILAASEQEHLGAQVVSGESAVEEAKAELHLRSDLQQLYRLFIPVLDVDDNFESIRGNMQAISSHLLIARGDFHEKREAWEKSPSPATEAAKENAYWIARRLEDLKEELYAFSDEEPEE